MDTKNNCLVCIYGHICIYRLFSLQDNCKDVKNKGQANWDGDKFGDICDNCMYEPNDGQENADKDDTGDICDEDYDNDGRGKYFVFNCITCSNLSYSLCS